MVQSKNHKKTFMPNEIWEKQTFTAMIKISKYFSKYTNYNIGFAQNFLYVPQINSSLKYKSVFS